jgi:hypothetical protein
MFQSGQKKGFFWICFSVLEKKAGTTLTVVKNGSPWLRVIKSG